MLALTLFFTVNINYDWRTGYLAWYGSLFFVLVSYLYAFNGCIPLKLYKFTLWFLSFMLLCTVSMLWSLSASIAFVVIKTFIVFFAVLHLIQFSLHYGFKVEYLLKCYLLATVINAVYVIITVDIAQLGEIQLGSGMIEGWNGNGIGFLASNGAIIGAYLIGKTRNKTEKLFYIVSAIGLIFLTLYTGSRTAFLVLVVEYTLYFCLINPAKMFRRLLISAGIVAIVFVLVMRIEVFYNVLGSRIEGLFALWSGEGEADSSASIRQAFIDNGIEWFKEQPLVGYGVNNYKILNQGATGRFTYAHNNFIEIAVDLGLVGLIWYYSAFVVAVKNLLKNLKKNKINVFLISILLASLVGQYGTVCYYNFFENFLLLLCLFTTENGEEREHSL